MSFAKTPDFLTTLTKLSQCWDGSGVTWQKQNLPKKFVKFRSRQVQFSPNSVFPKFTRCLLEIPLRMEVATKYQNFVKIVGHIFK